MMLCQIAKEEAYLQEVR